MVTSRETRRVLVVPDLHCPFQHPDGLAFLKRVQRSIRPTSVVVIGDEIDAHKLSRYTHNPDLPSAGDELAQAREALRPYFEAFPEARVCVSNHTWRPYKKAQGAGLPSAFLRGIGDVLSAPPGWRWAARWDLGGVLYVHGDGFSGAAAHAKAASAYRRSVVMGHVHSLSGVQWLHGVSDRLWGLAVGCLIDPESPAFSYAATSPLRPALGCGIVVHGVPSWLPLN